MCPMICERLYELMLDAMLWLPDPAWSAWAAFADALTQTLHLLGL